VGLAEFFPRYICEIFCCASVSEESDKQYRISVHSSAQCRVCGIRQTVNNVDCLLNLADSANVVSVESGRQCRISVDSGPQRKVSVEFGEYNAYLSIQMVQCV
jgi:hypothetical protein